MIIISFCVLSVIGLLAIAFFAGEYFGYRKGVREVVTLNDVSYRMRMSHETEELKKRGSDIADMQKRQLKNALEYERNLKNLGVSESTEVKTETGNVIVMPLPVADKPVA